MLAVSVPPTATSSANDHLMFPPVEGSLFRIARRLHRSSVLRQIAKVTARRLVLTQPFHGGRIAFNAVTHSWAWTGDRTYESFDRPLQDRLVALSQERPRFLDVGANLGAMTLTILLRNPAARALAVEPGREAASLLRRSLRLNRLEDRCELLNVAASNGLSCLHFNTTGSVLAHVTDTGSEVPAVDLPRLADRAAAGQALLMKIDVEGYEVELLPTLARMRAGPRWCVIVELHPQGFNGMGDPVRCLATLRQLPNVSVSLLGDAPLDRASPEDFTQVEVHWT